MTLLVRDPDLGDAREPTATETRSAVVLRPELALLAGASFAAAVLHAAFAPGHFDEDWAHGLFFAVVAWLQLALGVALLVRPRRWVFALGLLNAGVIAVWVVSRTTGLPFGPSSGVAEDVGVPDLVATGLEAIVVLGCAALLVRSRVRGFTVKHGSRMLVSAAAFGTVLVAAASTLALTPRFADEHHHGTGAVAADGHDHSAAAATGAANGVSPWAVGTSPCELTGPPASEGQVDDGEGHDHRGAVAQLPIDRPTAELLAQQQAQAREAAARYATVADAEAAGYHMSTVYVPCIGAHYTNIGLVGRFDPAHPSELLYDGTRPDSKIVGLSFLIFHPGGAPDGFAGPNDHWHQHNRNGGLCLKNGLVVGAESTSPEECTTLGGQKTILADVWMVHDWVVPGWDCSWGVFAGECPELGGRLGADAWTN
jgi:hypothetical protein